MKRIVLLCLILLPMAASAHKILSGDIKFMKTEHKLQTSIDFSQAQYTGDQNGRAFLSAHLALDSTYLVKQFYTGLADELENRYLLVGDQPEARYEVVVRVQQVAANGKTWSVAEFTDRESGEVVCTVQLIGDGGHLGTFLSLWGDGLDETGEDLGSLLKKNTKK